MSLQLYNTLTRQKEEFKPRDAQHVAMYVCGPNLYGPAHIGHALSYITFDVLKRYLKFRGYGVKHVQNFTDIEDRIIESAKKENTTIEALAEKYIARFLNEMDSLNIQRADVYPRATEAIPTIIKMTQGLIEKGMAYELDGDVYFRVRADEDYGKLSHRSLDEMEAGARVAVDERKYDPMDFALWKSSKPGEPAWASPWGPGRPGWHIECSAMNLNEHGAQIDIHGGGQDVLFPHHENEIAQSESYTGKQFSRYWVHNALLHLPGQDKMTRHLGGLVLIPEALSRHSSDAIRAFILGTHYRSPLAWTEEGVDAAERGLERLRAAVKDAVASTTLDGAADAALNQAAAETRKKFIAAMDDDLNTAGALGTLYDLARDINRARGEGASPQDLAPAQATLQELAGVLGLMLQEPKRAVSADESEKINALVAERNALRAAKKYAEADKMRAQLTEMGVEITDSAQGTTWRKVR
ncbi:MAG: cysteine--tRNA ligase [Chloroflexota bacterium]|nr:MAG: cysteine--tRNA ligase [Chloroflexota bacterium]